MSRVSVDSAGASAPAEAPARTPWLRRIGVAGFLFFLIKGLLWLTVPAAIAAWRGWAG